MGWLFATFRPTHSCRNKEENVSQRVFTELQEAQWAAGKFVCVGLDSDLSKVPACIKDVQPDVTLIAFNSEIIKATARFAGAYKLNSAFYEAEGAQGIEALACSIRMIQEHAPGIPVILDAKRADIGDTNKAYAKFAFEYCSADALTVHPYLGRQALQPLLDRADKGIIVLCRTSNPGAGEFQDLSHGSPLYLEVARRVATVWNTNGNCGLVTGATYPDEIGNVRRQVAPNLPLLIPGIGKQGGDLRAAVCNALDSRGRGFWINSSSNIIFASKGEDFACKAGEAAAKLHDEITAIIRVAMKSH